MKRRLLSLFKIRELPDPPPGSGPSLLTFRASRRLLYLNVLKWIPKQISTLIGIVFALVFFGAYDLGFIEFDGAEAVLEAMNRPLDEFGWDLDARRVFKLFELLAVAFFFVQFVVSGSLLKISWELRWYMVGDESLRIREGLWRLREQTVTIANIQNMSVRQGPIQKLFGIADLEVLTAGGGASARSESGQEDSEPLHVARFQGLEDAQGLRDRILARLVRHRDAGLGDADDLGPESEEAGAAELSGSLAQAARELLEETRALRRVMTLGNSNPGDLPGISWTRTTEGDSP